MLSLSSGCIDGEKKALYFELGPGGVQTDNVDGDWALKAINLGVSNVGTENIRSWEASLKLIKNDEIIDEKNIGPLQGLPPDTMRAFKLQSLSDNDLYLLRMTTPEPGEYIIRLQAYDETTKEKVGEADIPFSIRPQ